MRKKKESSVTDVMTSLGQLVKNPDDLTTFESLIKQYDRCIDIQRSVVYLHTDIEYGTLYDIMNNVTLILKCRPLIHKNDPITISLHSYGGSVYEMFGIIDYIRAVPVPVNVITRGIAMSAAAMILACGTGVRAASKNSYIMLHELSSETSGKMSDLKSNTAHLEDLENSGTRLLADVTGKSYEFWESKMKKDFYLTPSQALELGIIDQIID